MWKLLAELFNHVQGTTMIYCDNQSGIKLSENPVLYDRSKHINIRYHYIRDMVQRGAMALQHILTNEQVADILSNHFLPKVKFFFFREHLGVQENVSLLEGTLLIKNIG